MKHTNKPLRRDLYLLIDVSAYLYAALFALRRDFDGDDLHGMMYMSVMETWLGLARDFRTNHLVFCFDSKHSLRREIYPEYKAKRAAPESPEDIAAYRVMQNLRTKLRRDYLPRIGFRNVFCRKGYEADDLIAAITQSWLGDHLILSSDRDLWQCLAKNVRWLSPKTGELVTRKSFCETTGLLCPTQWRMVKMIGGCISDNVKGVPGVAEKSAIKFVMKRLSGAKLKAVMSNEGQKVIKRNRELVVLPMKRIVLEFEHDAFNIGEFEAVCRELGIKKMLKERDKWTDLFVKGQVNE